MSYENEILKKIGLTYRVDDLLEFSYVFVAGPHLAAALEPLPEGSFVSLQRFNPRTGEITLHQLPGDSVGVRVKVGKYFLYLGTGRQALHEENTSICTDLHFELLGYKLYYPSHDDIQAYWKKPSDLLNRAEEYSSEGPLRRSKFLAALIRTHCEGIESALEIGCNIGRNLNHLKTEFKIPVAGIEISDYALTMLQKTYPAISDERYYCGLAQEQIKTIADGAYDLVYSMAVLMHLHPTTGADFWTDITRIARKNIITIENESNSSERHWPRNYQTLLAQNGFQQIDELMLDDNYDVDRPVYGYTVRIFEKK